VTSNWVSDKQGRMPSRTGKNGSSEEVGGSKERTNKSDSRHPVSEEGNSILRKGTWSKEIREGGRENDRDGRRSS